MFIPTALQSTTVDFWSLSEIKFFFRGRVVTGAKPYSFGVYPGGESPWSLIDEVRMSGLGFGMGGRGIALVAD
jgi:hypothetical protein